MNNAFFVQPILNSPYAYPPCAIASPIASSPSWQRASGLPPEDLCAWAWLGPTLFRRAEMIAFLGVFQWITIFFFCCCPWLC